VRRVGLDYGEKAEVVRHAGWSEFLNRREGRLLLFTTRGAVPFQHFSFQPTDVLLFGRESAGVPEEVHAAADARLYIPLVAGARSLNIVTAAAMALGEGLRQTTGFPTVAGSK
jgi:tRNA (cytidine/uridine-2'-O-)-methyltransferase